jgi:hypothetical protein
MASARNIPRERGLRKEIPATEVTTVLFRAAFALSDLLQGKPLVPENSVDLEKFADSVDVAKWKAIDDRFMKRPAKKGRVEQIGEALAGD